MSDDSPYRRIADAATEAARAARLDVEVGVVDEVVLMVGPPSVPKGHSTEDAPLVEARRPAVMIGVNYLITAHPGRYVVYQRKSEEDCWLRRKTRKGSAYKSLRRVLMDIFEGITWDRIKSLKDPLRSVDSGTIRNPVVFAGFNKIDGRDSLEMIAFMPHASGGGELVDQVARPSRPDIDPTTSDDINLAPQELAPQELAPQEETYSPTVPQFIIDRGDGSSATRRRKLGVPDLSADLPAQPRRHVRRPKRSSG